MIYLIVFLACCVVYGALFGATEPDDPNLDFDRVARAIKIVENWDGRSIGAAGEIGPYQFRPAVWLQFSSQPLSWASSTHPLGRQEQERVARRLVEWIAERLPELNLRRSAYSVGLVWTVGYGNMKAARPSKAKKAYAERVFHTYNELMKEKPFHP